MSFQHLTAESHRELGKLLTGAAKAVFVASMIALFYPGTTEVRPYGWIAAGAGASILLGWIGIALIERASKQDRKRSGGRAD
ncbi:MAG: hypothetical protein AAB152_11885 [Candidatus Coatesbacteria bacterium]